MEKAKCDVTCPSHLIQMLEFVSSDPSHSHLFVLWGQVEKLSFAIMRVRHSGGGKMSAAELNFEGDGVPCSSSLFILWLETLHWSGESLF